MTSHVLSPAEMSELKVFFATSDLESIRTKAFANPKYKDRLAKLSPENVANFSTGIGITQKVAKECDDAEWQAFLTTGTIPPVKLTAQEMELVRGGAVSTATVGAGVIIGAGVSALVVVVAAYA